MISADDDKEKASEADLRKAVKDLKKEGATEDCGDMPVDSSLGNPVTVKGTPVERLPPDDEEN